MNTIYFDGKSLREFGVVPNGAGIFDVPARNYKSTKVNGRDGDVITDLESFDNISISYECYISRDFKKNFEDLRNFLLSRSGYCKLEDTYDKEHYRMAYFSASIKPNVTNWYDGATFTLTFNCKPQHYLTSGSVALELGQTTGDFKSANVNVYTYAEVQSRRTGEATDLFESIASMFSRHTQYYSGCEFVVIEVKGSYQKRIEVEANDSTGTAGVFYLEKVALEYFHDIKYTDTEHSACWVEHGEGYVVVFKQQAEIGMIIRVDGETVYADTAYNVAEVFNPTSFTSKPNVEVDLREWLGSASMNLLVINGTAIKSTELDTRPVMYIDAETMRFYAYQSGELVNLVDKVGLVEDIFMKGGRNIVAYPKGVNVRLYPNWCSR